MSVRFVDAVAALPARTRDRLAGPVQAVALAETQPVAFAGHVLRLGERGLLVLTDRELIFAAQTGRVDRTPLDRLTLAIPRETLLTIAPGEGGRRQDEFRPLTPPSFAGVEWPAAIAAVQPGTRPRTGEGDPRRLAAAVAALFVLVVAVALVLALT